MSEKYPASSIVLAKVKGYPAWPAMVLEESLLPDHIFAKKPKFKSQSSESEPTVLPIKFFNDDTYFWMKTNDLKPLSKDDIAIHFAQSSQKRRKDNVLETAFEMASNPLDMETFIKFGSHGEPSEEDFDIFEDTIEVKAPPKKKQKTSTTTTTKKHPKLKIILKKDPKKEQLVREKEEERKLMLEYDSDWGIDDFNKYDKLEGNYIYETKQKQQDLFSKIPDSQELIEIYNEALERYKTLEFKFLSDYLIDESESESINYKSLQKDLKEFDKMIDEIPKSIITKSKILRLLILNQRKSPLEEKDAIQFYKNVEKVLKKLEIVVRENTEEDFEIKSVESTKLTTPEVTTPEITPNPESSSSIESEVIIIPDVKDEDHTSPLKNEIIMSTKAEEVNEFDQNSNGEPQINSASLSNPPDDDDDEDGPSTGKTQKERRKIEIKFIQDKSRRHITFSKRKAGIMKKAYELSVLTGTQVLLLVVSETGLVYTFTTPKLQPLVTKPEGKNLIQACLNAPEEGLDNEQGDQSDGEQAESPEQSPVPVQQPPQSQPQQQQQQQPQHHQQHQQQQAHLQHQQNAVAAAAQHAQQQQQQQHQQVPQNQNQSQHPQLQPLQSHVLPPHYGQPQQQQQQQNNQQQGAGGQQQVPYGDYAYFSNMQNNNIPNQQQYQ
ncbi:uncharacterized protein KGF55_004949 [Candida pseudojiufengensis]|nr:uncharacterized protein KGF55_004949 [Candida pseudojiufengensis]KAI5959717.1 hypothetical protein KGF55_004949 [Candida pseudojiufengensis]